MRPYPLTLIVLLMLAVLIALQPETILSQFTQHLVAAQTRRPAQKRRPPARVPVRGIDYSKFSHSTKKHQEKCNSCHVVPTGNWQKSRGFPDVADFPDHEACVSCHRQQFFKGERPVICTDCHSVVSPRGDARLPFRNPMRTRQFTIEFPHDRHQDVIARHRQKLPNAARAVFFLNAGFALADQKKPTYNNCEICHGPKEGNLEPPPGGWIDGFKPAAADVFKSAPEGHSACFNCHYKGQAPLSENCEGCHKPAAAYDAVEGPRRVSMKFRHSREQHIAECTTCHINITRAATLRGLKPDVPITACSECHNKSPSHLEISGELGQIDKNRDFVCVYCHTSDVGKRDAPLSHYLVAERPQVKRQDIK
jgi:class III cytochrome C family protein